jgi:hypothetical protein
METMRIGTVRPSPIPVPLPGHPRPAAAGRAIPGFPGTVLAGPVRPGAFQAFRLSPCAIPTGAVLRELRLEPGAHPRIHLTIVHPVHHEVQITLVSLPSGVHLEVRCARPEQLARRWPRMRASHRVRFVRTPCDGPAQARRQPAI